MCDNALVDYLYDKEFLISTFGKLDTTVSERTKKFFAMWCEWDSTRMFLKKENRIPNIKKLLKNQGLKEMQEYQIKGYEIRFKNTDIMAIAKLTIGEFCV